MVLITKDYLPSNCLDLPWVIGERVLFIEDLSVGTAIKK